jgi:hypothetical protein
MSAMRASDHPLRHPNSNPLILRKSPPCLFNPACSSCSLDAWLPREQWRAAEHVLFVTDNRFPGDGAEQLPAHVQSGQSRVRILRAGKTARVFQLYLYDRRAQGSL